VSAIIATTDEDLSAMAEKARAKKVPIVCSDCLGPRPTGESELVWRILPPLRDEARLAAEVAKRVLDLRGISTRDAKIALLSEEMISANAYIDAIGQLLPIDTNSRDRFRNVMTKDPRIETPIQPMIADLLIGFGPDVIIVSMQSDFQTWYLPDVENRWAE